MFHPATRVSFWKPETRNVAPFLRPSSGLQCPSVWNPHPSLQAPPCPASTSFPSHFPPFFPYLLCSLPFASIWKCWASQGLWTCHSLNLEGAWPRYHMAHSLISFERSAQVSPPLRGLPEPPCLVEHSLSVRILYASLFFCITLIIPWQMFMYLLFYYFFLPIRV